MAWRPSPTLFGWLGWPGVLLLLARAILVVLVRPFRL
jgi:hypothetical protein